MNINTMFTYALAQEITVGGPVPIDPEPVSTYVEYMIPQTPTTIFILFLLPIVMIITHIIFTLKYWPNSKKIFRTFTLLAFPPLILLSWQSIYFSFIWHRLAWESIVLIYAVWPFYFLLFMCWMRKYFSQKEKTKNLN